MTQERMSIDDLARLLPPEARYAFNVTGGVWYGATHPLEFGDEEWQRKHGHWLAGIILEEEGLAVIRPKVRWRADIGGSYWWLSDDNMVYSKCEEGNGLDERRHACGNYWPHVDDVRACADAIKALAMKMHEAE